MGIFGPRGVGTGGGFRRVPLGRGDRIPTEQAEQHAYRPCWFSHTSCASTALGSVRHLERMASSIICGVAHLGGLQRTLAQGWWGKQEGVGGVRFFSCKKKLAG